MKEALLKNGWKYSLLLLLIYFSLFLHIGGLPLMGWDESRLAIDAYEMYHNGNYLIPAFDKMPDMWNTKPPLMIWFQVLFMKLFGVNELGIRLPSVLAVLTKSSAALLILPGIFVNNGSKDVFFVELMKLAKIDKRVFYFNFSKNYWKQYGDTNLFEIDYANILDNNLNDKIITIWDDRLQKDINRSAAEMIVKENILRKKRWFREYFFFGINFSIKPYKKSL
jgi:hypothetical protein